MHTKFRHGNLKKSDLGRFEHTYVEDIGGIFEKQGVTMWTGVIWLRIGTSGVLLCPR
jgi:hypothetical protein